MSAKILVHFAVVLISLSTSTGCEQSPSKVEHVRHQRLPADVEFGTLRHRRTVYVPIYSDIYHHHRPMLLSLTATLSVRNTSLAHSLYVKDIDYYDTYGRRLRRYLKNPIKMRPLESIEFEVEESEKEGGSGANFLVVWGAQVPTLQPMVQAVMIGVSTQQGVSFITEGQTLSEDGYGFVPLNPEPTKPVAE